MTTIDVVIQARQRDLGGGFFVRRTLPAASRRHVGPFVFFDHMGPQDLPPGTAMDVRPHPHIGLATVTFLFEGEMVHRDSLGSVQSIRPGDVNWMVAGRGIVHSERAPDGARERGGRAHGIQSWVALPLAHEETDPSFEHHPAPTLPIVERPGAKLRVLAGTAYGTTSPAKVLMPTLYVDAVLEPGATLALPDDHAERAVYVVEGSLVIDGQTFEPGALVVFVVGAAATIHAPSGAHAMLLGGAPLDGPRHIFWNFVSSSRERIEDAKNDWRARTSAREPSMENRFASIPGDDVELIPLPEGS